MNLTMNLGKFGNVYTNACTLICSLRRTRHVATMMVTT